MEVWIVQFLLVAVTSLFESKCRNFNRFRDNYDEKCKEWWDKANSDGYRDKRSCVILIWNNCPDMIDHSTIIRRSHDGKDKYYEKWDVTVIASLKSQKDKWISYDVVKKMSICHDNSYPECDFRWTLVKNKNVDISRKEVCINNISQHCGSKIEKIGEEPCQDQWCLRGYDIISVTYKYGGETASFNRITRKRS